MTLAHIIAVSILGGLFLLAFIFMWMFRRWLKKDLELQQRKLDQEKELHEKEQENWRQVDSALKRRIAELEKTCRSNQITIADLKTELQNKENFMQTMKVADLYKKYKKDVADKAVAQMLGGDYVFMTIEQIKED